jgi:hypothetical protein
MGLLDDAIREHLDLKRRRGADPAEIERAEREALGPVRREPLAPDPLAAEALVPEPPGLADDSFDEPGLAEHPAELGARESEAAPGDVAEEVEPASEHRRHGLFGRLRRGGEASHADEDSLPGPRDRPPRSEPIGADDPEPWDDDYAFEDDEDLFEPEPRQHEAQGTVAFHPPSEWEHEEETGSSPAGDLGAIRPDEPEPTVPPPPRAGEMERDETDLGGSGEHGTEPGAEAAPDSPAKPPPSPAPNADEDVLEETPEFLQDTPDHDRLWFEQRPPRDFDFDG